MHFNEGHARCLGFGKISLTKREDCSIFLVQWNSSPNMIEMKVAKDGSTKLAMPILLRMLTNNGRQVPNEDLC
jgi:hypothetical protein